MNYFRDKVIWITGASSGIGEALALQLSASGARLILTSRNENALQQVKSQCTGPAAVLPADLSAGPFHDLVQAAISEYGKIDILINNAGIGQRATAEATSEAVLRRIMELDFYAPVLLTQAIMPHFRENGGGQVVVTGSMAGLMGVPHRTAYSAAKHAAMGYFESLQTEHDIPGFSITIISPGRVRTNLSLNALHGNGARHGQMDEGQEKGIPAATCARKMIQAISRQRKHVVIAGEEKWLWWMRKFIPPLYYTIARKYGSKDV